MKQGWTRTRPRQLRPLIRYLSNGAGAIVCAADGLSMSPDAQTTDHLFTPFLMRAQLVTCGLVLTAGVAVTTLGAVDLSALRALFY